MSKTVFHIVNLHIMKNKVRWRLKVVHNSFRHFHHLFFDGSIQQFFISWCYKNANAQSLANKLWSWRSFLRISLKFAKRCILPSSFFRYKRLKLKLRVSLTGYTVTMVTCYVMTMTITCSPLTGHFFDTIIVASTNKELLYWFISVQVLEITRIYCEPP